MHRIFTWGLVVGKNKEVIEPAEEQEAVEQRRDPQMCPCGCGYKAAWYSYPGYNNYEWQSPEDRIKLREAEYDLAVQALADARVTMATARARLDKARG